MTATTTDSVIEKLTTAIESLLRDDPNLELDSITIGPDGVVEVVITSRAIQLENGIRRALRDNGAPKDFLNGTHRPGGACHQWAHGYAAALVATNPIEQVVAPGTLTAIEDAVRGQLGARTMVSIVLFDDTHDAVLGVLDQLSDEAVDALGGAIEELLDSVKFELSAWDITETTVLLDRHPKEDAHWCLDSEDVEDWLSDAVAPYGVGRLTVLAPFTDDDQP